MEAYKAGRLAEAVEAWEAAVTANPGYAPGLINLSLAYVKRGRPDDAIRCAQRAVELAPRHGASRHQLGNALAAKGRWNEAVTEYLRAFELDPSQWTSLANAAVQFLDHGMADRAADLMTKFLAGAPADHPRRAEIEAQAAAHAPGKTMVSRFDW
jgi:tetratricopeptide (TPR) repeat protein